MQDDVFVFKGLRQPLVGRPAITSLNLLLKVEPVSKNSGLNKKAVIKQFPKLFRGLGTLKGTYQIKLIPNAVPFVLITPRHVPIPLLPKVKAELKRMEQLGVISRIEETTSWCAGMVVVPKGDGSIRICVDLTKLNKAVCRERHLLPSVEQSLESLKNATTFS